MKSYAHLFEGLTVRTVLWITLICMVATGMVVWFFINTYLDRLTAVTAEQVKAVASTWLRPQNRAVVAHLVATEEEAA